MIRKQLIFKTDKTIELDYNYQHDVLRNIYRVIDIHDRHKARFLHREGYSVESGHKYKGFNFTILFENAEFGDNIRCGDRTVIKLILSGKKDVVESIIKGIMLDRCIEVSDSKLQLLSVDGDKKVYFNEVMLYSALSPVVVSTRSCEGKIIYQSIYDENYFKNLAENAKRKYEIIYGKKYMGEIYFDVDDVFNVRDKFIRIKNGGIKGALYDIWVQADRDMQKIIYYLGLGQNSSIGAGCLNFVKGVRADG